MRPTLTLFRVGRPALEPLLPPPTPQAFRMVRDMLSERPRHRREMLADAVGASPAAAKSAAQPAKAGKGKAKARQADAIQVPEGHPFHSLSYLKRRILPVLESQYLIQQEWLVPPEGSAYSSKGKKVPMWVLSNLDEGREGRWERLTADDCTVGTMAETGAEARAWTQSLADKRKEADFDSGREERTDAEVMAWPGRPQGLTTPLERRHLNTRRARARPIKEARRLLENEERQEARREAEQAVRAESASP